MQTQNLCRKSWLLSLLVMLLMLEACQTSTQIQWDPISSILTPQAIDVCLQDRVYDRRAKGSGKQVGTNTFALFAIPVAPIYSNSQIDTKITQAVTEAIEGTDIRVNIIKPFERCNANMSGKIMKFWYTSFNWFWPFCTEKGDIEIDLKLFDKGLNKTWQKKYSAHSRNFTFGGAYGYTQMIKKAMDEILNQIQHDLNSAQFRALL